MDMRVEPSGRDDLAFASNDIRARTDDQVRMNAFHDIRITGLANANNETILDTNVCLVDT